MSGPDPEPDSDPDTALETVRSIAVDPEAVVDAAVYSRENPGTAVLRVTPPFHGRMRARIHVFRDAPGTDATYCRPPGLLDDEILAAYPSLEDATAEPDGEEFDPDDRASRARVLEDWRDRAESAISDEVVLKRGDERVGVDVVVLG